MNRNWQIRFFLVGGSLCATLLLLPLSLRKERKVEVTPLERPFPQQKEAISLSKHFPTKEPEIKLQYPDITKEVSVRRFPSPFRKRAKIELYFPNTGEKQAVSLRKTLYLTYKNGHLAISKEPTLFSCRFISMTKEQLKGVLSIEAPFPIEKNQTISLPLHTPTGKIDRRSNLFLLSQAKHLGKDKLKEKIEPFHNNKERIVIGSQLLHLNKEEFLIYDEGLWKVVDKPKKKVLVARISKQSSEDRLFMEAWDESGKNYFHFPLSSYHIPTTQIDMKQVMKELRIRSNKKVSCYIEKQRKLLEVGDALVKEQGHWKHYREKDAMLSAKGELFYLDKIEKKEKEAVLSGYLFNVLRNQSAPVTLTISPLRHQQKKHHRRRKI